MRNEKGEYKILNIEVENIHHYQDYEKDTLHSNNVGIHSFLP